MNQRDVLLDWQRFALARSDVLRRYPGLVFQEAINEPDATSPAQAAEQALAAGEERRPFIRWLNKPQSPAPCLMTLAGHKSGVNICAMAPDGCGLVSGSYDGTFKFWDLRTGHELATQAGEVLAFSPDGSMVLSQSPDKALRLWDIATRQEMTALPGPVETVSASAFSPDGLRVVCGSQGGTITLCELAARRERITFPQQEGSVSLCVFSPDGSRIVSKVSDGPWRLWDSKTGNVIAVWPNDRGHNAWAFSPDGSFLVFTSEFCKLILCDTRAGRDLATLNHNEMVTACAISPDSSRIVAADMYCVLKIWDASTAQEVVTLRPERQAHRYEEASYEVDACAFSPDGTRIVSLSTNGHLVLWDPADGSQIATLVPPIEGIGCSSFFIFSPDGSALLSTKFLHDEVLMLRDVSTGRALATLAGHKAKVLCCAFSADGSRIVSGSSDATVKVWDVARATRLDRPAGHTGKVSICAFSPDGSRIVSGSKDGILKLWDSESGRELMTLDQKVSINFKIPNRIEYFQDESGRLRSSSTPDELLELLAAVKSCAFSPDGSRIVSESESGDWTVWDVSTGRALATSEDRDDVVTGLPLRNQGSLTDSPWRRGLALEPPVLNRSPRITRSRNAVREVWVVEGGAEIARFPDVLGEVTVSDVSPIDSRFVVCDDLGFVYILKTENISIAPRPQDA
jgi:WD40 repeat protein